MKFKNIGLKDVISAEQAAELKNDLEGMRQNELKKIMPYIEHYITVAVRERFPDIQKTALRNLCGRIVRKEFAFACRE